MGARKNAGIKSVIIEYSSALFAEKGVEGTGLKEIAEKCDISKGTLYYYFPNKEKLVCVCAEALFAAISEPLYEWMRNMTPETDISEICRTLAEIFTADRQRSRLLISLVSCNSENVRSMREAAFEQWRIMLELAAMRMNEKYGKRFEALAKTLLPLIIGLCALGTDSEKTAKHIRSALE